MAMAQYLSDKVNFEDCPSTPQQGPEGTANLTILEWEYSLSSLDSQVCLCPVSVSRLWSQSLSSLGSQCWGGSLADPRAPSPAGLFSFSSLVPLLCADRSGKERTLGNLRQTRLLRGSTRRGGWKTFPGALNPHSFPGSLCRFHSYSHSSQVISDPPCAHPPAPAERGGRGQGGRGVPVRKLERAGREGERERESNTVIINTQAIVTTALLGTVRHSQSSPRHSRPSSPPSAQSATPEAARTAGKDKVVPHPPASQTEGTEPGTGTGARGEAAGSPERRGRAETEVAETLDLQRCAGTDALLPPGDANPKAMTDILETGDTLELESTEGQRPPAASPSASGGPAGGTAAGTAVVVPPPYSVAETGDPPLELRGSLDCWACSVLVTAQNLVVAAINAGLVALIFGTILAPATVMVVFGALCHSKVRTPDSDAYCSDLLTDAGCVALLVVGFLLVTPLLVLALAAYCRLARHLQLGLCFVPYSRAVYKNLPAAQHRGLGGCCGQEGEREGKGKVWV
ncbi:transmembrane protein 88 b [Lepisosteus oculatus]|uniref:transmembrane protein 88 b n=1 Tax=Lepisosteus oculatus TaxID=7918 RepID=UPI00372036EA